MLHHVAVCNKQLNVWMKEEVVRQKEDGGRIKVGKFVREAVVRNNLHTHLNEGWTESKLCKGEEIEHEWGICEGRQVGGGSCTYSNSAPL